MNKAMPLVPEHLKPLATLENLKKNDFWVKVFQPEACAIPMKTRVGICLLIFHE